MSEKTILKNTLSQEAFFQVNKCLISVLGLTESALVSVLVDGEVMHGDEDGWFFMTAEMAQTNLNIGRKPYESALSTLTSAGIIESELRGCPAKKFFKINHNILLKFVSGEYKLVCPNGTIQFVQNVQTSLSETDNNKKSNNKKEYIKKEDLKENKKKDFDLSFVNIAFEDTFKEWLEYKRAKGQSYKNQKSLEVCYRKLLRDSHNDPHTAQLIIENAIANNYTGFFELKRPQLIQQPNGSNNQTAGNMFSAAADELRRQGATF